MRIACLLDTGFEDSEFRKPRDAFVNAGHDVVVIGLKRNSTLDGYRGTERVQTDMSIEEASPVDFDALFIPGGYSPDHLRINPQVVAFTRSFFDKDRPVFAVCHGPQLLMTARVVDGRSLTAWPTVQDDLRYTKATVLDQEVVVDRYLVTSRKPDDLEAFSRESLHVLDHVGAGARV